MSKVDITEWEQKDKAQVLSPSEPEEFEKAKGGIRSKVGKASLLVAAGTIIYSLAKGVRNSEDFDQYTEKDE